MANEITNTRDNTSVQARKPNVTAQVKALLNNTDVQKRFQEVLGAKASQFMASVVNVVHASPQLQKCNPNSIMGAAFVAATFDLPIDNNLGFSAIVPYGDEAQFQMMYKGFVQLAIRSGYYEKMNCSVVYRDEVMNYNPITGELEFVSDFSGDQRISVLGKVEAGERAACIEVFLDILHSPNVPGGDHRDAHAAADLPYDIVVSFLIFVLF